MNEPKDQFVTLLTGHQNRLYAFILSLVGNPDTASDLLQQTNLVLWHKADSYVPGTHFSAWAFKVARFEVMGHRKKVNRELLIFGDDVLDQVVAEVEQRSDRVDDRLALLQFCMGTLTERHRDLLAKRYREEKDIKSIASQFGLSANATGQALHRARLALVRCIREQSDSGDDQ